MGIRSASLFGATAGQSGGSSRLDRVIVLFVLAILPMALDFKSEGAGAGAVVQVGLILLCVGFSALFWVSTRPIRVFNPSPILAAVVMWFCLVSGFVGYIEGQQPYSILVNMIPVGLLVVSSYVTQRATASVKNPSSLLASLKLLALSFMISRVAVVAFASGIDLATARYQILGGSVNACLGLLATSLVFGFSSIDLLTLGVTLGLVAVSVTRSQILVALGEFGVYLLAPSLVLNRTVFRRLLLLALFPLLLVAADQFGDTGIVERWVNRVFAASELGVDPTLITRSAEVQFMSDAFTESGPEFLFGHGLAAETSLAGDEAATAAAAVGRNSIANIHAKGFGHHNYWSILFIGGIVGGFPLLLLLFYHGLESLRFFGRLGRARRVNASLVELGLWGSTIILGMLLFGFLAGTFGDRPTCLWYGVGIGLLFGCRDQLTRALPYVRKAPLNSAFRSARPLSRNT